MRNPYIFGFLPFVTVVFFSLTFGVYTVGISIDLFKEIGLYSGMREFLSDIQLRLSLLIIYALFYFMVFSAMKLIGETIHNSAMLFFSRDMEGKSFSEARAGNVIYFFGAIATAGGIHSIKIMGLLFLLTTVLYFIYTVFKLSKFMSLTSMIGLIAFEVIMWGVLLTVVIYISLKLYNGVLASLPIT
ncbi:DUF5366 family protein [Sporosarcina ureilytica]|uniref:YufK family protein n=1 Tax=Sporosarcina ureilytica TaxID=298596 RepID=A0A1D8JE90_9BACL|nr:DUF5366 family protein [Sporosarcina ureilytica]AOV07003.1 hypothetical protein BI350_05060 [Sporosarcina ureilytica]